MKKTLPKSLPKLLEQAQKVFNAWIRERDKDEGCISCGKPANQAGHYFPVKGHSYLRFHTFNVHGQCAHCNCYLHGNQAHYRQGLVMKIGEGEVLNLERYSRHGVYKWSRYELEEIIKKYTL
jgi:hypothetical protein